MRATPYHPAEFTPLTFTNQAGVQPAHLINQWPELLTKLFQELNRHVRWAAREEYELLVAETAAATAEADRNEEVLTVNQAAQLLGLRPQTVYEWVKAEKLQAFKVGRGVRFKRGQVLAALKQQIQPDGRRKYARRTLGGPSKTG